MEAFNFDTTEKYHVAARNLVIPFFEKVEKSAQFNHAIANMRMNSDVFTETYQAVLHEILQLLSITPTLDKECLEERNIFEVIKYLIVERCHVINSEQYNKKRVLNTLLDFAPTFDLKGCSYRVNNLIAMLSRGEQWQFDHEIESALLTLKPEAAKEALNSLKRFQDTRWLLADFGYGFLHCQRIEEESAFEWQQCDSVKYKNAYRHREAAAFFGRLAAAYSKDYINLHIYANFRKLTNEEQMAQLEGKKGI